MDIKLLKTYPDSLSENRVFVVELGSLVFVFDPAEVSFLSEAHDHNLCNVG